MLEGILDYVSAHEPWDLYSLWNTGWAVPPPEAMGQFDGMIIDGWRLAPEVLEQIRERVGCVSSVRGEAPLAGIPTVLEDFESTAELALEHLQAVGMHQFAYVPVIFGSPGKLHLRFRAFRDLVLRRGLPFYDYYQAGTPQAESWAQEVDYTREWIRELPRPTGVFAFLNPEALRFIRACQDLGGRVPDDYAVLSYASDPIEVRFCQPPLSTVDPNSHRIGWVAAELLDRQLQGDRELPEAVRIAPLGVIPAGSTNTRHLRHPGLARALAYMSSKFAEPVDLLRVSRAAGMSPRSLQNAFRKVLRSTFSQEMTRIRLERARGRLVATEETLEAVAARVGFPHASHLCRVFKKRYGITPARYRAEFSGRYRV